jgi:anthranilate phosphoribosyltransferase
LPRFGVHCGIVRSAPVLSGNKKSFAESWALGDLGEAAANRPAIDGAAQPLVLDCGEIIPGLSALDTLRGELGFRSCLHTAEKLLNPWQASPMLLGISHKHYALRMAEAMRALGLTGKIVLGNHGTVDLVLHKETELVAVDAEGIREETVAPAELGLQPGSDIYSLARFPQWKEWLLGPASGPTGPRDSGLWQALLFHLAVFLWAAGAAPDPESGLAEARRVLAEAV